MQRAVVAVDGVVARANAIRFEDASLQPARLALDATQDLLHLVVAHRRPRQKRTGTRDIGVHDEASRFAAIECRRQRMFSSR